MVTAYEDTRGVEDANKSICLVVFIRNYSGIQCQNLPNVERDRNPLRLVDLVKFRLLGLSERREE
eukprot:187981-Hanusia_phi.AAC.1